MSLFYKDGKISKISLKIDEPSVRVELFGEEDESEDPSTSSIRTTCEDCCITLETPKALAGQCLSCPKCGKELVIGLVTLTKDDIPDSTVVEDDLDDVTTPHIDISDILFKSDQNTRFNEGVWIGEFFKNSNRAIGIKSHPEFQNNYLVSIYNLDGEHPIWRDNLQMAPKRMKVIDSNAGTITLRGFGLDDMGSPFSDYGLEIYLKENQIDSISLFLHDRDVKIDYLDSVRLGDENTSISDSSWIEKLWEWADKNEIHENILPRDRKKIKSLESLRLMYSKVTELPPEIGNFSNLVELDIRNLKLAKLPSKITKLQNLKKLKLWNIMFPEFPMEIFQLLRLEELDIGANYFKKIPPEIGDLHNLKELVLVSNHLKELPAEISNLKQLEGLYLTNNKLKVIPEQIFELNNLRWLDLRDTQLEEIPNRFIGLPRLELINLLENPATLPTVFLINQGCKVYIEGSRDMLEPWERERDDDSDDFDIW